MITLRKLGIMPIVYGKERKGLSVRGKVKVRRDDDDLSDDDQKRFNTCLQKTSGVFSEHRFLIFIDSLALQQMTQSAMLCKHSTTEVPFTHSNFDLSSSTSTNDF